MTATAPNGSGPVPLDEAVHYNAAAKALRVSRKTVERMVGRGELERDTTRTDAHRAARVSRRSLVAALEARRDADTTPAGHVPDMSGESPAVFSEVLGPLVAELVEARAEAASAQAKLALLEERAHSTVERAAERDELLASLVAGSWRERRRARRNALARLAQAS